jgi:hypothetical protein
MHKLDRVFPCFSLSLLLGRLWSIKDGLPVQQFPGTVVFNERQGFALVVDQILKV